MKGLKTRPLAVLTAVAVLVLVLSLPAMADQVDFGPEGPVHEDENDGLFGPDGPVQGSEDDSVSGPEDPIADDASKPSAPEIADDTPDPGAPEIAKDSSEPAAPEEPSCSQPYVLETQWQHTCSS